MPIETNISVAPYFDDYREDSEFYGILYKPSVSVQARELNQMQSILRNQIEKFGDAIFQIGTIIDGCNFVFYPAYPYIKIKDLTTDGLNVTLANYEGLFTRNTSNVQAIIVDSAVGFETTPPDLNTLYLSYRNSGLNSNTFEYSAGDVLTIFDSNTGIWGVTVNTAGVSFANSDVPVFTSGLAVNVTTGTFANGDYITQPTTGANLQIIHIDVTTLASVGQVVFSLKPRTTDLANSSANGSQWAPANNDTIRNTGNTAVGLVQAVIGSGAGAGVVTDGSGRVIAVPMTSRGLGYTTLPTVTIKSPNNTTGVTALSLVAQNYLTKVTVSNTVGAVGNGYAFGVSAGTIYQKGMFLKVDPQIIIVDKYDQTPNNVSVGFHSNEEIINSNIDTSLLDNASGFRNYQAPGADRLKLIPTLLVQSANVTSPDFLPIVSWSEGNPYRQNQTTSYSAIGDKMAQELFETEGDFVISRFQVTSRSPFTQTLEGTKLSILTSPGSAYIKGRRVFNNTNYSTDITKTTDTAFSNNRYISLNYGNWVRVNQVGGVFQFSTGDTVTFYDTPRLFISNTATVSVGNTTPLGTVLGTARIRSMTHEFGIPGDANATYRLYLFSITLGSGVNFSDIRAIGYGGNPYPGICDVVLVPSGTSNTQVATLANTDYDFLMFDSGAATLKNATDINYTYRTIDQTTECANTGLLTKNISGTPSETFPYVGSLNSNQLLDLYVVPVGNNLIASANVAGTSNVLLSNTQIKGNSSTWTDDFAAGDFVYMFQNTTVHDVKRVISVSNNSVMNVDSVPNFTGDNIALYRYFPKNAAIPLGLRTGLTANVSANQQLLTINLGMALEGSVTVNTAVGVNILRTDVAASSKTAGRDQFIKICTSNNAGGTDGPWCLGVSDVFRLKRVFMDTANTVSNTSTEVTSYFYIDHKQNEDFIDLAYLYPKPQNGIAISNGAYLLCQFDAFQASGAGFFHTASYSGANSETIATVDSTPLATLGSSISSWEIPECFGSRGQYFDLMKFFDFRPIVANSVVATANSATAPLNPVYALSFGNTANPSNDKKFPLPDSVMQYSMEQYCFRTDVISADATGKIMVTHGIPVTNKPKTPHISKASIRLSNIYLPPYPCLPAIASPMQTEILATGMANIRFTGQRQAAKTVVIPSAPGTPMDTQPRRFTMSDIGALSRRVGALEYYGSLSALQTDMANRVVPSSVDGTHNRFKFGFFVDPFDSTVSQDLTNPSYAAQITSSNMTPPVVNWVVGYGTAKQATVSYIDFPIVKQPDATTPKPPPPVVIITPTPVVVPPVVILLPEVTASANVWMLRTDHLAPSGSGQIVLTDYAYPVFSGTSGPATLYFYINPTTTLFSGSIVVDPDNFLIYQGSTLILNAYNHAASLTGTDIAYLQSAAVPGSWFANIPLGTPLGRPSAGFVNGAGKLSWTHNPALGQQYTIVSSRQSNYDHWIWGLEYPSQFGSSFVVSPTATTPSYAGHMDVQPATLLLAMNTPTGYIPTITIAGIMAAQTIYGQPLFSVPQISGTDYTSIGTNLANYYSLGSQFNANPYDLAMDDRITAVASTTLQPQSFGLTIYGLKPSTSHEFYVNNVAKKSRTVVPGQGLGGPLISDANGVLRFNYYFDGNGADQDTSVSLVSPQSGQRTWATEVAAAMAQPIGIASLVLSVSAPGSSANFTLQVVADADLVLSTVTATASIQPMNDWSRDFATQQQANWFGGMGGGAGG